MNDFLFGEDDVVYMGKPATGKLVIGQMVHFK